MNLIMFCVAVVIVFIIVQNVLQIDLLGMMKKLYNKLVHKDTPPTTGA